MLKKKIYQWHRTASLIIAVPVLLWALSGFMHPIMTNLRPAVQTQSIAAVPLDTQKIRLPLQQILQQQHIDSIYSVRLVHIDTNWFYQVKTGKTDELYYFSAKNGNQLIRGDWLYAQYLARTFLEGPEEKEESASGQDAVVQEQQHASLTMDCCGEATASVLNNERGAPFSGASVVRAFNEEYKRIYALLPVYKVTFKRSDNIRLYVETAQDRFAVAVDKNRAAFTRFFNLVHTWAWLDFFGKGRIYVELFFCGLAFLTALMGLYLFFTTKTKKVKGNTLVKARRKHRITSIIAVLFTLMFTFSGFYHALSGLEGENKAIQRDQQAFASAAIDFRLDKLQAAVQRPITNIGLVRISGQPYWQVFLQSPPTLKAKDLMKDLSANAVDVTYVRTDNYRILPHGDAVYARELAGKFSGYPSETIVSSQLVTHFTDEYNFTDKRLPVWKVDYPVNHRERLYVETSTGVLAKCTNDLDLYEGYSFALFHKHHYMDFAGKTVRDISTMIGAGLQVLMIAVGLMLYLRWRKRKRVDRKAKQPLTVVED